MDLVRIGGFAPILTILGSYRSNSHGSFVGVGDSLPLGTASPLENRLPGQSSKDFSQGNLYESCVDETWADDPLVVGIASRREDLPSVQQTPSPDRRVARI
jgi:hypothetical protein